jgi:hypothetical protein
MTSFPPAEYRPAYSISVEVKVGADAGEYEGRNPDPEHIDRNIPSGNGPTAQETFPQDQSPTDEEKEIEWVPLADDRNPLDESTFGHLIHGASHKLEPIKEHVKSVAYVGRMARSPKESVFTQLEK